jgi:protein required for attachment to host cells
LHHLARICIADGERARIFINDGTPDSPKLRLIEEMTQQNPLNHERGGERPGRLNDSIGFHKSAVEATDQHRLAKMRFAAEIAARLGHMYDSEAYRDLFLVASPAVLGELRQHLRKDVAERVTSEIAKDLTKHPVVEIVKILAE